MDKDDLDLEGIAAVCFDAFGTLIGYGGRRLNPYRRLLTGSASTSVGRLPFLTRNVSFDVFARDLGLEAALPAMERELAEELAGLILYSEVEAVLDTLREAGRQVAVCSNLAAVYGPAVRELVGRDVPRNKKGGRFMPKTQWPDYAEIALSPLAGLCRNPAGRNGVKVDRPGRPSRIRPSMQPSVRR